MTAQENPTKKNPSDEQVPATPPVASSNESDTLSDLAAMLNEPIPKADEAEGLKWFAKRTHAAIQRGDRLLSVPAWRVGHVLTLIKKSRSHGDWKEWEAGWEGYCDEVLHIHHRKAQRYMKLLEFFKTEEDIRPFGLTEAYGMCQTSGEEPQADDDADGATPEGDDSGGTGTGDTGNGATDDGDDPTAEVEKLRKKLEDMATRLAEVPDKLRKIDDAHVAVGTGSSYVEMLQSVMGIASALQPAADAVLAACEKFKDLADQGHDAQKATVMAKVRSTAAALAEMLASQFPAPKQVKVHTPETLTTGEPTACEEEEKSDAV